MKTIILLFSLLLSTVVFSQWTQKGLDIDGEALGDFAGNSVSQSADGSIVAIGALGNDDSASGAGQVRVYEWNGSAWIQKGIDIDGELANEGFGFSVSLSSNGNTLAVGAPNYGTGYVKILDWNSTAWTIRGSKINGQASNDYFGERVQLSADGNTVVAGGTGGNDNGPDSGQARVFEWNGTMWVQKGGNINGEYANDGSGIVSINDDGSIIASGAISNDDGGTTAGNVRVFEWNGTAWTQMGSDLDGVTGNHFGTAVSLNSLGTTIAIGGDYHESNGNTAAGFVQVYEWNGTAWIQKGTDVLGDLADDWFGRSVYLSDDGNSIAVGAPGNDGNGSQSGQVKVFKWNGTTWNQFGADIYGEAAGDRNGRWVSLSASTSSLVMSAPRNNSITGHSRVYTCATTSSLTETICGATYTSPSGNYTWNTSGTYNDTIPNSFGCDSIITITLTLNSIQNTTIDTTICYNSNYTFADLTTASNIIVNQSYSSNFTSILTGCDSNVTENITVLTELTGTHNETVCFGESIIVNGTTYDASNLTGIEVYSNVGIYGCDSTVTVNLTILPAINISVSENGANLMATNSSATYQWLENCNTTGTPISGETNQTYTAPNTGNYAVIITEGNCIDTSDCYFVQLGGLDNSINQPLFSIFPNPANHVVSIESNISQGELVTLSMFDVTGKLMIQNKFKDKLQLDINSFESGIYVIRIQSNSEVFTQQLVIE